MHRDGRSGVVREAILQLRNVKVLNLTERYLGRIHKSRDRELVAMKRKLGWQILNMCFGNLVPILSTLACILCAATWAPHRLTPTGVFTSLAWFAAMEWPIQLIPILTGAVMDVRVALRYDAHLPNPRCSPPTASLSPPHQPNPRCSPQHFCHYHTYPFCHRKLVLLPSLSSALLPDTTDAHPFIAWLLVQASRDSIFESAGMEFSRRRVSRATCAPEAWRDGG